MQHNAVHPILESTITMSLPVLVGALIIMYLFAVFLTNRRFKKWSLYRTMFWIVGVLCASLAVIGPIAEQAHHDFRFHMISHLLLGMLAPLLMALAAPMTLLLRMLPVNMARVLSRILRSRIIGVLTNPIIASVLNIGGLWILYTTPLYTMMHASFFLHSIVHLHIFLAGYLFTISMISIDPAPHRKSFRYRSIVLIIALAGHGILSKLLYAYPPAGVTHEHGETGAMLMYYGGDIIDFFLIFVLCLQWFRATKPKVTRQMGIPT